jgi:Nose resistant-to-fluoxetine protein, N-terminal domain
VFDSSSKIPGDGIIDATFLIQIGNFDQCLSTSGPTDANNAPKFKGKYCIFQPGFQGTQIEMMNDTISSSLKIQTLMQQTIVSIIIYIFILIFHVLITFIPFLRIIGLFEIASL